MPGSWARTGITGCRWFVGHPGLSPQPLITHVTEGQVRALGMQGKCGLASGATSVQPRGAAWQSLCSGLGSRGDTVSRPLLAWYPRAASSVSAFLLHPSAFECPSQSAPCPLTTQEACFSLYFLLLSVIVESQNGLGCKGAQRPSHSTLVWQGHLALSQGALSPIQPYPKHFQGWSIRSFSGQPESHHPTWEEFHPVYVAAPDESPILTLSSPFPESRASLSNKKP